MDIVSHVDHRTLHQLQGAFRYPLTSDFAETLLHYTCLKNLSSITRWGIKAGIDCGKNNESCIYLAATDFDAELYKTCAQKVIQHDLEMPHLVGHPPRSDQDIKLVINYSRLFNLDPELCQDESFAISCRSHFTVPWNCLEAAINMDTNTLMWVNPDFYDCYFVAPTGETQVEVKVETQAEVKEELQVLQIASITCSWRNVSEEIAQYARDAWRKSKLARYGVTLVVSPC